MDIVGKLPAAWNKIKYKIKYFIQKEQAQPALILYT